MKKLIMSVPAESKALQKWDTGEVGHDTGRATGTWAPDPPTSAKSSSKSLFLSEQVPIRIKGLQFSTFQAFQPWFSP